ncbi:putative baseplate assembly protein [Chitinimonas lacunae]|uniref:Baseplate assembly protein n=1 Tax=Chitinimonas lacunae TaxID=1963018 RepID=A0ABV8MMX9_9NEIS
MIDDRRFADLVAEARTRIPRYTPEWTDVNDNEPGMAVVQLMAWMSELLIARLGRVPQLNYLKFLELLGVELTPARPARTELTFPVLPGATSPTVIVPLHTQVSAEAPDGGPAVIFETERALVALAARLDAVQVDQGRQIVDVSPANAELQAGFLPFGATARTGNALLLGFDSPLEFPSVPIDLTLWVGQARQRAPLYVDSPLVGAPPATLAWEYWNGKDWYPLDTLSDETAAFTRSGHILIGAAPRGGLQRATLGQFPKPRYWLRARLAAGGYVQAPRLLALRTNTVPALAASSVDAEVVGRSNGLPDQVFQLAQRPVLAGTLALTVDEGDGPKPWVEVADFFGSGRDDPHYVLNRSTGEIRFNGTAGRIPVANPSRVANIVAQRYRVGGGAAGNVAAGAIDTLRGHLPGIDAARVGNLFAAYGGADEESLDAARLRAAGALKSRERAVTREDFELHAIKVGGVARARALPLYHPAFPAVAVPGAVSVLVVPQASDPLRPLDDPAPQPTEGLLRQVCAELDARRLATTELYVIAPSYRLLRLSATLTVSADADLAAVKQTALLTLRRYFHPLIGGEDCTLTRDGSGWPFGGDIHYSRVVQRLLLPGVNSVDDLLFELDRVSYPPCSNVSLDGTALLRLEDDSLDLRLDYEVEP